MLKLNPNANCMNVRQTPRKVRHQTRAPLTERHETIIHAAWRVVAGGGLPALTIRSVAAELQLTTGAVMHYFPTKDALLEKMIDRLYTRLREIAQASVLNVDLPERLERIMLAGLPLSRDTEFGWKLAVMLQPEVLRSPAIAALFKRHHNSMEAELEQELGLLAKQGRLKPSVDLHNTTIGLMALVEGLGTCAVLRPEAMTPQILRQLVQEKLADLIVEAANLPKSSGDPSP
ncbi:TetR/AcrR family transcriptional regulator [Burkholderia cenocepacia]|uniref:TetR/AcrR family transcriptional regulator n=1 Tax=Burkholderia cenocepacia TaxID=95486 RepID=UPI002ABE527A|nr:TetR/AcrR family transcriptional regulator [Burkholderia cenocepacia]